MAGQIVLLGLLLAFLFPLGLLSYVLGDVLRETIPGADPLALINGGMLYLMPAFIYLGPHVRTPADASASTFTMNTNTHGLRLLPILLAVIAAPGVALLTNAWWIVGGIVGGLGLVGLLGLAWTRAPLARKLDQHRRDMVEAFREREPI